MERTAEHTSTAVDDYLKSIFHLTRGSVRAGTRDIADALRISQASVTAMLKKLAAMEPPMVDYRKREGVVLTKHGEKRALSVIRHHRLLETFLYQTLGYSWDEVHDEACRLEHVISDRFEEGLVKLLGNPTHDPHGDPIPDHKLRLGRTATEALSALHPGDRVVVERVDDKDAELLRYLAGKSVLPGRRILVLSRSNFDGNLSLQVSGCRGKVVLGPEIAERIFVRLDR
ncbi:MAG: metal-dependent transcriptional regulator [Bacteroidetes bacterium]|nr:metal-dependent transcriptional regulator [Bacteroidota bacterium]